MSKQLTGQAILSGVGCRRWSRTYNPGKDPSKDRKVKVTVSTRLRVPGLFTEVLRERRGEIVDVGLGVVMDTVACVRLFMGHTVRISNEATVPHGRTTRWQVWKLVRLQGKPSG